jgi:phosphoribosylaminoimidazolecarboxamide formyltransferase/IMP cyclohydrolase
MAVAPPTSPIPDLVPLRRALLSVFDKTGLVDFARALHERDVELISTGGSRRTLADAGLPCRDVAELTGFPEIMGGRVKTLHPKIHGGLLGVRDEPEHAAAMSEHDILGIDLLVVNLYPFEDTVAGGASEREVIENVDIGGPAMIRAAAKNHAYTTTCVDPHDYAEVLTALERHNGATSVEFRRRLAARAFARTAAYDAAIATWFANAVGDHQPASLTVTGRRAAPLRYGENPHQSAALYLTGKHRPGVATAEQIQGKQLSYNNINDTDAAYELVAEFDPADKAALAIIKHANPCGVATAASLEEAYRLALRCDPVSAFGGIVATNRPLDAEVASQIVKVFTEVVIAPGADAAAREILSAKKNLRVLIAEGLPEVEDQDQSVRSIAAGFLVQERDRGRITPDALKVVTRRSPTEEELADLIFAWRIAKHVKSNAIVYARGGASSGIGAGQMSRLDSALTAARKAGEAAATAGLEQSLAIGSVCASDAFFPFADGLIAAVEAGATAIIQPGGSIRDDEVIAAADERGLAMVFTGMRHFRH